MLSRQAGMSRSRADDCPNYKDLVADEREGRPSILKKGVGAAGRDLFRSHAETRPSTMIDVDLNAYHGKRLAGRKTKYGNASRSRRAEYIWARVIEFRGGLFGCLESPAPARR